MVKRIKGMERIPAERHCLWDPFRVFSAMYERKIRDIMRGETGAAGEKEI